MIGLAYGAAASRMLAMPKGANTTSGNSAVTGTGIASVAHQIAIQIPAAATRQASVDIACCHGSANIMTTKIAGPRTRPTTW